MTVRTRIAGRSELARARSHQQYFLDGRQSAVGCQNRTRGRCCLDVRCRHPRARLGLNRRTLDRGRGRRHRLSPMGRLLLTLSASFWMPIARFLVCLSNRWTCGSFSHEPGVLPWANSRTRWSERQQAVAEIIGDGKLNEEGKEQARTIEPTNSEPPGKPLGNLDKLT